MDKIMSIDSLYKFFVEQDKTINFSAKDSGKPIVVSVPGNFEESDNDMPGMLKLKLKVCHIDTNRNGSHISKENMEKAMPSLKYRPILAYIHKLEDGTEDFYAHNIEIVEDENGEEKVNYTEKQVGCFTADEPYLEYDKDMDKTYVNAYAVIPEEYTSAADIIRRKNGTKVSCELVINELSYNAKEKYLDLTDFYFGGTTLLGCDEEGNEIGEGMLGARADITDFCHKEPIFTYQDKLIEVLDKLNITLSNFNINHSTEKGGEDKMDKFNELLEKYGFTEEELDFDREGMTDEELEVAFEDYACRKKKCSEENDDTSASEDGDESIAKEEEACGGKKKKCSEEEESDEDEESEEDDSEIKEQEACGKRKKCSINEAGDVTLEYELSHDDIRSGLYRLLDAESENGCGWTWVIEVFDDKFIYQDYEENKFYRRGYTVNGDDMSLADEKTEVFNEWLSQAEKDVLNALKNDYAELESKYNELKTFKDNYDAAELKAQKDEVFANASYEVLAGNEDFEELKKNAENFSLEEVITKAKLIFADYVQSTGEFSKKNTNIEESHKIGFNFIAEPEEEYAPYGNILPAKKKRKK